MLRVGTHTHTYIIKTYIHLNTAQISDLVIGLLVRPDEVNPEIIRAANRLMALPATLFPLLTTLTVTVLSGESPLIQIL